MTITEAIDELRDLVQCRRHEAYKGRALRDPDCHCDSAEAVEVVARAFASGELFPLADHKLAVALMVEKAAQSGYVACAETRHVSLGNKVRDTIRALAPADALAELQALRAGRDAYKAETEAAHTDITTYLKIVADMTQEAETDKAELAALRAQVEKMTAKLALVQRALEKADEGLEYMGLYAPPSPKEPRHDL